MDAAVNEQQRTERLLACTHAESHADFVGLRAACVQGVENWFAWDTNPLYAVLHEAIYCQGAASQWAAQRVRDASFADAFDALKTARANQPVMFTGRPPFSVPG